MVTETISREAAAALWYVSRRPRESQAAGLATGSAKDALRVGLKGRESSVRFIRTADLTVNVKDIFPGFAMYGPGFYLCQICANR